MVCIICEMAVTVELAHLIFSQLSVILNLLLSEKQNEE